jgi:hypothetical protein
MRRLTDAAWNLVCWPGCSAETYRSPWQMMEVVGPGDEVFQGTEARLNTLGTARYRVGRHREALDAFSPRSPEQRGFEARIFLTLTLARLGPLDEASPNIPDLPIRGSIEGHLVDGERVVLDEAKALIYNPDVAFPTDPFAR